MHVCIQSTRVTSETSLTGLVKTLKISKHKRNKKHYCNELRLPKSTNLPISLSPCLPISLFHLFISQSPYLAISLSSNISLSLTPDVSISLLRAVDKNIFLVVDSIPNIIDRQNHHSYVHASHVTMNVIYHQSIIIRNLEVFTILKNYNKVEYYVVVVV